jgi:hypothetical protein
MSILLPSVRCKTCDYPPSVIILPYPDPPGALQGTPEWPSADWKSNLACQECGSVFPYSSMDIHWGVFTVDFLNALQHNKCFYTLHVRCADADCKSLIRINVYAPPGTTIENALENLSVSSTVRCRDGHRAKLPPRTAEVNLATGPIESK